MHALRAKYYTLFTRCENVHHNICPLDAHVTIWRLRLLETKVSHPRIYWSGEGENRKQMWCINGYLRGDKNRLKDTSHASVQAPRNFTHLFFAIDLVFLALQTHINSSHPENNKSLPLLSLSSFPEVFFLRILHNTVHIQRPYFRE